MLPQATTLKAAYIAAHITTFNSDVSILGISEDLSKIDEALRDQLRNEAENEGLATDNKHDLEDIGHFFETHPQGVDARILNNKNGSCFVLILYNSNWHHMQVLGVYEDADQASLALNESLAHVAKEPVTPTNFYHLTQKLSKKGVNLLTLSAPIL